jgi:hypothetical protein
MDHLGDFNNSSFTHSADNLHPSQSSAFPDSNILEWLWKRSCGAQRSLSSSHASKIKSASFVIASSVALKNGGYENLDGSPPHFNQVHPTSSRLGRCLFCAFQERSQTNLSRVRAWIVGRKGYLYSIPKVPRSIHIRILHSVHSVELNTPSSHCVCHTMRAPTSPARCDPVPPVA